MKEEAILPSSVIQRIQASGRTLSVDKIELSYEIERLTKANDTEGAKLLFNSMCEWYATYTVATPQDIFLTIGLELDTLALYIDHSEGEIKYEQIEIQPGHIRWPGTLGNTQSFLRDVTGYLRSEAAIFSVFDSTYGEKKYT